MAQYTIDTTATPIDFECNSDALQRTIQNCKNLIMLRKGELPYDRLRGIDPEIFDLPLAEANEKLMPEIDRVLEWEPDASAVSAKLTADEEGESVITITVEIDL